MDARHWNGDDDREQICTDEPLTCECPDCRKWRDNYEPGDPDGSDLTLGERSSLERETQADVQRDLK